MADITIEANADTSLDSKATRGGPFWTSATVGYVIYVDTNGDLVYRKTGNGGATWGAATVLVPPTLCNAPVYDCWADWQTAGDAGTKIHVAFMSWDLEEVRYVYLDTDGDSVGGNDLIETCQGTGTFNGNTGRSYFFISITKTRGGNLAVAFRYEDTLDATFYGFYTSPDATTWTSEASPWEAAPDYILLFPGNEADNQDIWATFWDVDADEISLKTYDDSGNSWSEQLISASMNKGAGDYLQMDGAIRLSDGHLIFAAWSERATVTADLMTWDINGAGSIIAKTNVITNEKETVLVSVFINQANDDVYVAYVSGTDWLNLVKVFYQKSVDGGANWGGEQAMQANAEDDERWISAGCMKAAWGGKFQPVWFNDDINDIFTNTDNGVSIPVAVAAEELGAFYIQLDPLGYNVQSAGQVRAG